APADALREVDARRAADLALPVAADRGEVVREVVRGARSVAAVDGRDVGGREVDARVDLRDRRVVPLRDLAEVDVGDDRPGQLQVVRDAGKVVHDRGGRQHPRDLDTALAGRELVGRERRVTRAEVDRARRDRRDAGARPDGAVVDLHTGLRLV